MARLFATNSVLVILCVILLGVAIYQRLHYHDGEQHQEKQSKSCVRPRIRVVKQSTTTSWPTSIANGQLRIDLREEHENLRPGQLYNIRTNSFLKTRLWNESMPSANSYFIEEQTSSYEMSAKDSYEDRRSLLDIAISIKLTLNYFFGSETLFSGSARYINDIRTHTHQARVALVHRVSMGSERVGMELIGEPVDLADGVDATHVLIAIDRGVDSVFVFDQYESTMETRRKLEGSLKNLIRMFLSGDQHANPNLEKDEAIAKSFNCTFHSDLKLDKLPKNYEEAMKLYASLPDLIRKVKSSSAAPKVGVLFPLDQLVVGRRHVPVRPVGPSVLRELEKFSQRIAHSSQELEDLCRTGGVCNLLGAPSKRQIDEVRTMLVEMRKLFRHRIDESLPSITSGRAPETEILRLIDTFEASPFGRKRFMQWLKEKRNELTTLSSILAPLALTTTVVSIDRDDELKVLERNPSLQYLIVASLGDWLTYPNEHVKDMEEFLGETPPVARSTSRTSWSNPQEDTFIQSVAKNFTSFLSMALNNPETRQTKFILVSGLLDGAAPGQLFKFSNGTWTSYSIPGLGIDIVSLAKQALSDSLEMRARNRAQTSHSTLRHDRDIISPAMQIFNNATLVVQCRGDNGEWQTPLVPFFDKIITLPRGECRAHRILSEGNTPEEYFHV